MGEYEIIDCHSHFPRSPEKAGEEQTIIEEMLKVQDKAGVSRSNLLSSMPLGRMYTARLANLPQDADERAKADTKLRASLVDRLVRRNDWSAAVCKQHPQRFTFFCGVDLWFMDSDFAVREFKAKLALGARGVKMMPASMHIYPNDRKLWPLYEAAQQAGVPVLSQSGTGSIDDNIPWGHPRYFEEPLQGFPRLNFILGHLGMGAEDEVVRLAGKYPNLYGDTSHRLAEIGKPGKWTPEEAVAVFRRIGVDRVLFGTNYPHGDPTEYAAVIKSLPLTEAERRQVFSENFKRLVK